MTQTIAETRRKIVKHGAALTGTEWSALKRLEAVAIAATESYAELTAVMIRLADKRRKRGVK